MGKGSIGTLKNLEDIKNFIELCKAKRLDLEEPEFSSKAYMSPDRTGKIIKIVGSNEGTFSLNMCK